MGMAVLGWLTGPPVATWGEEWMRRGFLRATFSRAIAADQILDIEIRQSTGQVSTTYRDDRGLVCATGEATIGTVANHEPLTAVDAVEFRTVPLTPRAADLESAVMHPLTFTFDASRDLAFLEGQPDAPLWRERGWAHPAWLGTASNAVIMSNIDFDDRDGSPGRWLQVSADIDLVEPIVDGDEVELRSHIRRVTRRGRQNQHFVAHLDCTYRVETRVCAHLRNSFVFATVEPSPFDASTEVPHP
ncbi:MAG: hypothetical protein RL726_1568 [Actinomycetota bacterium]